MSVSDVSAVSSGVSSSQIQQMQANMKQMRANFDQLQQSLASGDLTGAQAAYSSIQQLQGSNPPPGGANSTMQQDFAALGQVLQSGDVTGAQKAFAQTQSDMKSSRHAHRPPPSDDSSASSAGTILSSAESTIQARSICRFETLSDR
jgi:hypothetical protein